MIPTRLSVCALAAALLVGCATTRPPGEEPGPDPLETGNRGIFWFNMQFDRTLLRPVAKGWGLVTPEYFRVHLDQMMRNLESPRNFLNSLLQGEVRQSGVELARFGINTTVGIVGFFDPASKLDLHTRPEDRAQ